jgi:exosortase A
MIPALAIGLTVFAALFWPEAHAAISVWHSSTAYGHCWLILPIACWLLWERRAALVTVPIRPALWPVLFTLPLATLWLAAYVLGIMEGRQFAAIGFLLVFLLALLGPRLWWALSAGLLYLVFLVPFGAFLTPALQAFTAGFVRIGLDALAIPNDVNALRIEIPEGSFYVAEACAGLRFLIASIAFGTLFAITMFRSPLRRALFIAVSCIIPVVANGFRGLGVVVLGHALGSAQAAAADHILYGWVFFTIVLLILALAGLPFRQDGQAAPAAGPAAARPPPRSFLASMPVLVVAAFGPILGYRLNQLAVPTATQTALWQAAPGCAETTAAPGPVQSFMCGQATIRATTIILPRRSNPAAVVAAARAQAVYGIPDPDASVLNAANARPGNWSLLADQETGQAGAYLLWVDGAPALGGLHDRLRLAYDLLNGTRTRPVAITVATTAGGAATLQSFLAGQADLPTRLQAASERP